MRAERSRRNSNDHVPAPRWRCLIRPCRLGGRWQRAGSNQEADLRSYGHYVTEHWRKPDR